VVERSEWSRRAVCHTNEGKSGRGGPQVLGHDRLGRLKRFACRAMGHLGYVPSTKPLHRRQRLGGS
jgi:hypothetical protein